MQHSCQNVRTKELTANSAVELHAELPWAVFETYRAKALAHIKKDAVMDGFRKGHVPDEMLLKHVGEGTLLQEAADIAIRTELPLVLAAQAVLGISSPRVEVTKLAPGNPLEFKATIDVLPRITLPDYQKIAKKVNAKRETPTVSESDVAEVLTHLRRERAKIDAIEKGSAPEDAAAQAKDMAESALPVVDDAFVHGLGYESAASFIEKLRENIRTDREARASDTHRIALIDAILEKVAVAIPHSLVDHEIHKMEAQFGDDLARTGMTFDEYLKRANKTHEDIHKEWHAPAQKRATVQLVLGEIATAQKIAAPQEAVAQHVAHTLEHHKDLDEKNVRAYYEHMLRNEAVLSWLEGLS